MVKMSDVWDRTTAFLRDRPAVLVPLSLALIFVPGVVATVLAPVGSADRTALASLVGVASLLLWLVTFWGRLAVMTLALDPSLSARGAAERAGRRFGPAAGQMLLLLLLFGVLLLPLPVALAWSGADLTAGAATPGALMMSASLPLALYTVAAAALMLWLFARLSLIVPVALVERAGIGGFRRSFDLTRGLALRIIGVLVLYALVSSVAMLATQTAVGSILRLVVGGEGALALPAVLTALATGAVGSGFAVVGAAFTAELYRACSARAPQVSAS